MLLQGWPRANPPSRPLFCPRSSRLQPLPGAPQAQPRVWGQTAGSSALCKVTRRLSLSLAELGILAWRWAHRTCQQPSTSTGLSPPLPGRCLPHPPRLPDWNFGQSPSPHPVKPGRGLLASCSCAPQIPASSHSVLQRPDCVHLSSLSTGERLGPTACQSKPSGWLSPKICWVL